MPCKICGIKLSRESRSKRKLCVKHYGESKRKPDSKWSQFNNKKCNICSVGLSRGTIGDKCKNCTKTLTSTECSLCGKSFLRHTKIIKENENNFCSRRCMGNFQSKFQTDARSRRYGKGQSAELKKIKDLARSITNKALKKGILKKEPCGVCKNIKSEGHHDDYSKPLEVIWLCRKCHMNRHKQNGSLKYMSLKLAERAAEQIKALLKEFHKNNP